MATLRYDVDVDTSRAERRIGAFALDMRQRITRAIKSLPDIELGADASEAQREIAAIRAELVALGRSRIGVDIDAATAQSRLEVLHARLAALQGAGDIQVDADVSAALAALGLVDAAVSRVDGREAEVKVKVDKSVGDAIVMVGGLARGLRTIALPASAVAIAPTIAAIGSAAQTASGSVFLLPAALAGAGLAMATLKLGTTNFGDALKALAKDKIADFEKAIAKMSPAAVAAAQALRQLDENGFKRLRLDVQEHLFAGLAAQIGQLANLYLPVLGRGMTGIADQFNGMAKRFSDFLKEAQTVRDLGTIFGNTSLAMQALQPVGANIARMFRDIAAVGSSFLPKLAGGFAEATADAADFISKARETGQLKVWIQEGIDTLARLGSIAVNVGSMLASIFRASKSDGQSFLQTLDEVTGRMATFLKSATGQNDIKALFSGIHEVTSQLGPTLAALAQIVVALAGALGGGLATALKILNPALQVVADIVTAMSPVLQALAPVIGAVAGAFLAWKIAMAGLGAVAGLVTGLGEKIAVVGANAGAMAEKVTGSAAAGERFASAGEKASGVLSKMGSALPLVGAGLIGLTAIYDQVSSKADTFAGQILNGSKTYQNALNDERNQLEKNTLAHAFYLTAAQESERVARADADARRNLAQEIDKQLAAMGPLEAAQARANIAQGIWNDKVRDFGANSPEAAAAARDLAAATDRVEVEQRAAADATKSHSDRMVEQSQLAAGFANADIAYEQSIQRIAQAQKDAAAAARDHGSASSEAATAQTNLVSANLAAADAARRKAEEEAKAAGVTDTSKIGADAYRATLFTLADQAAGQGDTSTANRLRQYANATGAAGGAAQLSAASTTIFHDTLTALGQNASGPVAQALTVARDTIDTAGNSAKTSDEKTRIYQDALLKAADQAALAGDTSTAGALRQMSATLDNTSARTDNTSGRTVLFVDELRRNAEYQQGPMRDAYLETAARLEQVSGSNMTAEQKTAAFKEEMQRLRDRSGGVLRPELDELARRVVTMPDGAFKVTGTGIAQWTDGSGTSWTINPNGTTSSRVGGLARGGLVETVVPGYTPGHDVHTFYSPSAGYLGLSGGEGILRPEAVRMLGGERGLADINTAARRGYGGGARNRNFMSNGSQSFREGGMFQAGVVPYMGIADGLHTALKDTIAHTMAPVILQAIQMGGGNVLEWVRTQVGKPYVWGGVGPGGYDCSGLVSAAINVMNGRSPHTRLGSTGSMPWPGMRPGAAPMGGGISVGSTRSVNGGPGHMAATVNGVNIESSGGVGVHMGAGALGANSGLFNMRYYMPGNTSPSASGSLEGGVGGGVTRWAGVVGQALARLGQSQALVGTVLRRMQQESGGNPNAINNWDSNAARGTPSKGLMQVIDPTFAAYRDPGLSANIYDPLANIVASMRYALARYGSLSAAYNRAGGYDLGGVADGAGLMRKSVLSPERVLSPRQTAAFDRLVAAATRPGGLGLDIADVHAIASAAVQAAITTARADADARPRHVVQWQAREPLGRADLTYVAAETSRLQAWNRRRGG